ncbi:MAG TPA: hypothetical protein VEC06_20615 [Paucimonas sp.]|nr:hypothetical protein [Paucimonas sp.]
MKKKENVTLTIGFDADQISDQLSFKFTGDGGARPMHPTGLFAGEIYFNEGEILHLEVLGGGNKERFSSFQVLDCCMVTIPQLSAYSPGVLTRHAPPSPFVQSIGATCKLPLDFSVDVEYPRPDYRLIKQSWKHTLDVGTTLGRWDLSLVLTVRIVRGPLMQEEVRVFYFDPEAQVGTGSD